jgi:polyhydroxyalkanoate synthesis repressor PhaR
MVRLVKRYGSRKLYDTEESRYATLDEIVAWIRDGQQVRIVDNATEADVTTAVLAQIIAEQGRRGASALPTETLHDLIRKGEDALRSGVEQVQAGVEKLLDASLDRIGPVRRAREDMESLKARIAQLESALARAEAGKPPAGGGRTHRAARSL